MFTSDWDHNMQICVTPVKGRPIALKVSAFDTVGEVKTMIQEMTRSDAHLEGLPACQQQLMYKGKQFADDTPVWLIPDTTAIRLVMAMRGGGDACSADGASSSACAAAGGAGSSSGSSVDAAVDSVAAVKAWALKVACTFAGVCKLFAGCLQVCSCVCKCQGGQEGQEEEEHTARILGQASPSQWGNGQELCSS